MSSPGLLLAALLTTQSPDTATYANPATLEIMQLARERHRFQDTLVHDYQATITTRMEIRAGRSIFARLRPLWVHETRAQVRWQRPNELNMTIEGVRARSVFPGVTGDVAFDEPWFVPRSLGDSVRLLGIPETAALHPFAPEAERLYQFAIVDSSTISVPGFTVRAIAIRVRPRVLGPSVVAGDLWVDRATGDVVRMSVTFLGEYVWADPEGDTPADSAKARSDTRMAQRFVTVHADLEYSLVENKYWMPWRQLLSITASVNLIISATMPARVLTTFADYRVNTGVPVVFTQEPDSGRSTKTRIHDGGTPERDSVRSRRATYGYTRTGSSSSVRWEITVPPRDSLHAAPWPDSLASDLDPADRDRVERFIADIETMAERLPGQWMGRPPVQLAWAELADIVRFNRVQGVSFGGGVALRPGVPFTSVLLGARFGTADQRVTGHAMWQRDAPPGRFEATVSRRIAEVEPWTGGQSVGNSVNAVFAGHDDADYYLRSGGDVAWEFYRGPLARWTLGVSATRHRSITSRSGSGLYDALGGDGLLGPNPAVVDSDWLGAQLTHRLEGRVRGTIGVEALVASGTSGARGWLDVRVPFTVSGRTGRLSLLGGTTAGDPLPQLAFRLGGPHTVRGYPYGTVIAGDLWAAQLDVALRRAWLLTPVVFADVGDTDFSGEPLVGVGGGLSLFGGWFRLNLAKGLNPSGRLRFDLLFGAPR